MYMYMYAFTYMCICMCIHICAKIVGLSVGSCWCFSVWTVSCMRMCIRVHMYACAYVCRYIYVFIFLQCVLPVHSLYRCFGR